MCGTMGFMPPELSGGFLATQKQGGIDAYKLDAYSFGVTLQLCLLGEDGAIRREIRRKGPMMLPLDIDEQENTDLLNRMQQEGRLSSEGNDLLVRLLKFVPSERASLSDDIIVKHNFFLKELNCGDLAKHLFAEMIPDASEAS